MWAISINIYCVRNQNGNLKIFINSFIIRIINLLRVSINHVVNRKYLYFPKQGKIREKRGMVLH